MVHERCHERLISKHLITANIRGKYYANAARTYTIVLMLLMYR